MIKHIVRKEFMDVVRDGRFRWCAALVGALLLVSLGHGWVQARQAQQELAAAQATAREHWESQGEKNPPLGGPLRDLRVQAPPGAVLRRRGRGPLHRHVGVAGSAPAERLPDAPGPGRDGRSAHRRADGGAGPAAPGTAAHHPADLRRARRRAGTGHAAPAPGNGCRPVQSRPGQGPGGSRRAGAPARAGGHRGGGGPRRRKPGSGRIRAGPGHGSGRRLPGLLRRLRGAVAGRVGPGPLGTHGAGRPARDLGGERARGPACGGGSLQVGPPDTVRGRVRADARARDGHRRRGHRASGPGGVEPAPPRTVRRGAGRGSAGERGGRLPPGERGVREPDLRPQLRHVVGHVRAPGARPRGACGRGAAARGPHALDGSGRDRRGAAPALRDGRGDLPQGPDAADERRPDRELPQRRLLVRRRVRPVGRRAAPAVRRPDAGLGP